MEKELFETDIRKLEIIERLFSAREELNRMGSTWKSLRKRAKDSITIKMEIPAEDCQYVSIEITEGNKRHSQNIYYFDEIATAINKFMDK